MADSTIKLNKGFNFPRSLGSGDDLDNLDKFQDSGIYYIGSGVSNTPNSIAYVALLVFAPKARGNAAQIIIDALGNMFYRGQRGDNYSWSAWKKLTGT